jgi:hypothetical protein
MYQVWESSEQAREVRELQQFVDEGAFSLPYMWEVGYGR